jgi:hypothetical protein
VRAVYRRLEDPDDPIIREVLTRMSRFACGLQTPGDIRDEVMYIGETVFPVKLARCRPGAVTKEKHLYLINDPGKAGRPMYFAPGVMVILIFINAVTDAGGAEELRRTAGELIADGIPGAVRDGNDTLVNGEKAAGLEVFHAPGGPGVHVQMLLTLEAAAVKGMAAEADFEGRKYAGITGLCDGTGADRGKILDKVLRLPALIDEWRAANG